MKIKFEKEEESLVNKLFIKLEYMSGDADAYEYEEVDLEIPFDKYKDHLPKIENIINNYKLISKFTDCNDKLHLGDERWGIKNRRLSKRI